MTMNFNTDPYYDDFSDASNFQKILFKPGYPVQSRELTQSQTILQDQIKKFGNHVFKHGSVVIPGNSFAELDVPYVKLQTTAVDITTLEGSVLVSPSGVKGQIKKGVLAENSDPATFYFAYTRGGNAGEREFVESEVLTLEGTGITFTTAATAATGIGAIAVVNAGVFYVNGSFISISKQSTVISKYSGLPSCNVLLKIVESIVSSDEDATLLDPAQGSYNFAAPGADRHKVSLLLTSLPLTTTFTDDYIELMRYNEGVLEEHSRYPKYNELEKSLARRTYDESGDYVVFGLEASTQEHLKAEVNGGKYPAPTGDSSKFIANISEGKAYIRGFENESISKSIVLEKGRSAPHIKTRSNVNLVPDFGQYFYVSDIKSLPAFKTREQVDLYNSDASNGSAVIIGSARVIAIDLHESNTTDNNAIYKLYVSELTFTGNYSINDIGGIRYTSGSMTVLHKLTVPIGGIDFVLSEVVSFNTNVRQGTVHKWTRSTSTLFVKKHVHNKLVPKLGDLITAPSLASGVVSGYSIAGNNPGNAAILNLPTTAAYRIRTASNAVDFTYKVYKELTITTNGSGAGSTSVTGMTIDPIEQGNIIISSPTDLYPTSIATVSIDGLTLTITGGPLSTVLKIVCAATKTNQTNRSKTFVSAFVESGITPAASITLTKADIYKVSSIISTIDGDVTNRYLLDNGQRDYAYLRGSLALVGTLPSGTLTITYDYFSHSGSGDYFSIDSYETSGLAAYYDKVYNYTSKTDGAIYDLRNCLDFRARAGDDGTYTIGTALPVDIVQLGSRIASSMRYYVPRIDLLYMSQSGEISVVTGTPSEVPKVGTLPDVSMPLCTINIPAYTRELRDIVITQAKNKGYTMREVGLIEDRVFAIEQYSLLTQTENTLINNDIIDTATGLSRYKSGYLVDSFENIDVIADIFNAEFSVSYTGNEIIPAMERHDSRLNIISNSGQVTGDIVTLPYTHVTLAKQPVSTRITNINPFAVFSWTGSMKLTPAEDNWVDIEYLPAIYRTETETINITRAWNWTPPNGSTFSFVGWDGNVAAFNAVNNTRAGNWTF